MRVLLAKSARERAHMSLIDDQARTSTKRESCITHKTSLLLINRTVAQNLREMSV